MSTINLKNMVSIVTGAANGIGKVISQKLLDRGAKVMLCDIEIESCQKLATELGCQYGDDRVIPAPLDVTKDKSFEYVFNKCKEKFGTVDILINNAGIVNEQNFTKTMDTNLFGAIRGTEMAFTEMKKSGNGGTVLNTASVAGIANASFMPMYAASKAGVIHYSRTVGNAFHYESTGVRVLCLCPALVRTRIIEMGMKNSYNSKTMELGMRLTKSNKTKILSPDEAANAMLKMIDEASSGSVAVLEPGSNGFYYIKEAPELNFVKEQFAKME